MLLLASPGVLLAAGVEAVRSTTMSYSTRVLARTTTGKWLVSSTTSRPPVPGAARGATCMPTCSRVGGWVGGQKGRGRRAEESMVGGKLWPK
jgi:hypothetical protein